MQTQFANIDGEGDVAVLFNSPNYEPDGMGLALSGGGYKAAAYHLGALIRLNEIGYLPRISRVSSVSGGSIAAGYLGLNWKRLNFGPDGVAKNFGDVFVEPLKRFLTNVNIDVFEALLGVLAPFRSGADRVAAAYAKRLYGEATLQDLPRAGEGPRFVLVATNYELNSLWRFSQPYAADYRVGRIDEPDFLLARIVAASSAFPPFFCPLTLDFEGRTVRQTKGANRHEGRFLRRAVLCDGGVYDNMGLEAIWKRYGTLLVSNAGDPIEENRLPIDWFSMMLRILGLMHRQAENNRQRPLMLLAELKQRRIAYWPLRNDNRNYPKPSPSRPSDVDIAKAQSEAVRLWSLDHAAFARLANHGYSLCDSATRSFLDDLASPPVSQLPFSN